MEYRTLGRTGLTVSAVSLGTEYLIDQSKEHVSEVILAAMAAGINYFDLFFAQPAFRGNMGSAFRGRREQAILAAHLGATEQDGQYAKSRDPKLCRHFFEDFLRRYETDYADILLLHNSDGQEDYDGIVARGGLLEMAQGYQRDGKARFIGFSGHTVSTALQAVQSGAIDVLMFPINLASHAVEGKRELLNACAVHNVGLVAMKPFAGGGLLLKKEAFTLEMYQTGGTEMELSQSHAVTPVRCLSYVLSQAGVSTIVPGCKDLKELEEALGYWSASDEEKDFSALVTDFEQYITGECVYCNHCLPCPSRIDIGHTLRLLDMTMGAPRVSPELYAEYIAMETNAEDCVECGLCTDRCPFGVDVIAKMQATADLFR